MENIKKFNPAQKTLKEWPLTKARAHVDQEDEAARGSLPALSSSLYKSQVSSPKLQAPSNKLQATSNKLQATSDKLQAGRRPAPGRGWGTGALPKRGWEIRALRQPQPPAKYTGFSRINQQAFCRRYLGTLERF